MSLPTPFYERDGITIYCGDNRLILPQLDRFDLLLADPPYGIGESSKKNATRGTPFSGKPHGKNTRGTAIPPRDYGSYEWDAEPATGWSVDLARSLCRWQIIFGGNFYPLPPSSCWVVWDKENSGDFADGEMAWTNLDKAMRIKRHLWNGMLRKDREERFHPTQKPLDVMSWCLGHVPDAQSVLDPWMGSGTTLLAAKLRGLRAVGVEINEEYCDVAVRRLQQGVLIAC